MMERFIGDVEERLAEHFPCSLVAVLIWTLLAWPLYLYLALTKGVK